MYTANCLLFYYILLLVLFIFFLLNTTKQTDILLIKDKFIKYYIKRLNIYNNRHNDDNEKKKNQIKIEIEISLFIVRFQIIVQKIAFILMIVLVKFLVG